MLTRRHVAAAAVGALIATGGSARAAEPVDPALFDALLQPQGGAPALIAAVLDAEGVTHAGVAGLRRVDAPDAATLTDKWHLGSNTKAMTAALYARLVETGQAQWSAPIAGFFPEHETETIWREITIEHLLGHRSGVLDARLLNEEWLNARQEDQRSILDQRGEFARHILRVAPGGPIGSFSYANANYMLAGAVIERITEMTWEDALRVHLFIPLGMDTAGFGPPQGAQPWGHAFDGALLNPLNPAGIADNPPVLGPAGRVHASIGDYSKFVRIFLANGAGFLSPDNIVRLTTPLPAEAGPNYALGWGVRQAAWAGDAPALGHEGSNTLWHTVAAVAPARGLAFIAIGNANIEGSRAAARTLSGRLVQRFAA